jgi:Tol biopolymer transport system component
MSGDRQSRIDELVQSALALEPEERASYLAQACSDDRVLEEVTRTLALLSDSPLPGSAAASPVFQPDSPVSPSASAPKDSRIDRTFGVYHVTRRIGAGGMGEVYLASDTRLGRQVALKFLPAQTAGDDRILRRFQSEARSASALNHPNILTIFDVGRFGTDHYIASEFVEGVTLRARLRRGPFELLEALEIITQVASALVAAHSAGVIHRDLKPTNIMLRPDGYVKVIDFGLAKRIRKISEALPEEGYTHPGTMVGTVDYMAPEQARGEDVDARVDIWSIGVVFYEMLAGRRPFPGQSEYHVIAQILESEPQPLPEPGTLPPEVDRILKRCLQKDREARYPSAADLFVDLREARRALNLSSITRHSAVTTPRHRARNQVWRFRALALVLLIAAMLFWEAWGKHRFLGPEPFELTESKRVTYKGEIQFAAVSPDGHYVAFVNGGLHQELGIKPIDSSDSTLIPSAAVKYDGLTFSNDGRDLFYVVRTGEFGKLYKIAVTGGDPRFVAADVDGPVAVNPRGSELAFRRDRNRAKYVVVTGGKYAAEEKSIPIVSDRTIDRRLTWSNSGKIAVFEYPSGSLPMHLKLIEPGVDGILRDIPVPGWRGVSQAAWMRNGFDLIVSVQAPDQAEEDMQVREISSLTGRTRNVTADSYGYHGASITADGNQLVTIRRDRQTRFWISPTADLNSGGPLKAADSGQYISIAWTDNDQLISQANRGDGVNVWLIDPAGARPRMLTSGPFINRDPVWMPHHNAVAFAAERNGLSGVWKLELGDGSYHLIAKAQGYVESPDCAPDGKQVAYTIWRANEASIWLASTEDSNRPPHLLLHNARHAVISPDGKLIAVETGDSNVEVGWRAAVYNLSDMKLIREFPRVKTGSKLKWLPDGKALSYIVTDDQGTSNLWSQPLPGGPVEKLTSFREDQIFDYAWSRDGAQLVCLRGRVSSDAYLFVRRRSLIGTLFATLGFEQYTNP